MLALTRSRWLVLLLVLDTILQAAMVESSFGSSLWSSGTSSTCFSAGMPVSSSMSAHISLCRTRFNQNRSGRAWGKCPLEIVAAAADQPDLCATQRASLSMELMPHLSGILCLCLCYLWPPAHAAASPATTIFLHGLNGHATDFNTMMGWMQERFGNQTQMHSLALYEGKASLQTPLTTQRDGVIQYLLDHAQSLQIEGGFNFVAHSQGALLARSVVQALPSNLSVLSLVSMAGPQHGQWGMCANGKAGLNSSLINAMSRDAGWLAFYNPIAQHRLSVANYWDDPNHQTLFKHASDFLPLVNNLVSHKDSAAFKANFLRLKRAVFLGSSGDDCINPPLSPVFEYVDGAGKPVAMNQSSVYTEDTFGLRTMQARGDLVIGAPPGQHHSAWYGNKELFDTYVAPNLL